MTATAHIRIQPCGEVLRARIGTPLRDLLFGKGIDFPCGGRAQCRACRIKVIDGNLPATAQEEALLSTDELAGGWRLGCLAIVRGNATLELEQWHSTVLADETTFEFQPREGYGIAVDLGTTTLAAQLLDLRTAGVLAVETALNPQAHYGADLMARICHAMEGNGAAAQLRALIRVEIGRMIKALLHQAGVDGAQLAHVAISGNTAMHHLFCGIDVAPLAAYPFEPQQMCAQDFTAQQLGWIIADHTTVRFLPCMGGFVGSDLLAGVLATRMHRSEALLALIDLGTNGEIVIGNRDQILCASTAAGPAFEGAKISRGMRASTGAIAAAELRNGGMAYRVLGGKKARGICGSGLVDVVAGALDLGWIQPSGRIANEEKLIPLVDGIHLTQADIRQLQLAKGAIAAGVRILLAQLNAQPEDLEKVYLAGAFGNYISLSGAQRIGLLQVPQSIIHPAGNTALLGTKMALFDGMEQDIQAALANVQHISLSANMSFQDTFVEEMGF